MDKKTFYITTPIYYPSDYLHIGHSYCTVATDMMARYKRLQGCDVMFLTGTDEHGQKIEERAAAAGKTPKEFVDHIVDDIKQLWKLMDISYDRYIRTTDDYHIRSIQHIFRQLYERGDIYKSHYKGMYCTPCESFWTESQLVNGNCPDCGRPVREAEEEAYFFRLSNYQERLLKHYEDNPDFLTPESSKNEMIAFVRAGLDDLCVSRTSFSWGVPVDFDPGHIVYVWVDALSNYITALGYGNDRYRDFDRYWPADVHFVGKEIYRFHTVIWPAILMALDLPLPKQVFGHGWLLAGGRKIGKSLGNGVDPGVLCERYGVDAMRYYLLREFPFGSDGNYTGESLVNRLNADLANDLGNLLSRSVSMIDRYFGGTLPEDQEAAPLDGELIALIEGLRGRYDAAMERYAFQAALQEVMKVVSRCNKYIDETAPWVLAKDAVQKPRLARVLYNLCEGLRAAAILLSPAMPHSSAEIGRQIGAAAEHLTYEAAGRYGLLPHALTVHRGDILFPRLDLQKELEHLAAPDDAESAPPATAPKTGSGSGGREQPAGDSAAKAGKQPEAKPAPEAGEADGLIGIDQFAKVKLIAARVTACARVEGSDKLLRLTLDDGSGSPRTVASGIAQWYAPEDIERRTIALVANLKPAKLRGVLSQGMILAADVGERASVIFLSDDIPAGAEIR